MLSTILLTMLLGMQGTGAHDPEAATMTNEEQVYFAREAGQTPPPWVGIRLVREGDLMMRQRVDPFGANIGEPVPIGASIIGTREGLAVEPEDSLSALLRDQRIALRVARPFTCWVSVRRFADRADGQADWSFDRNIAIHDQGGRALVQPDGAPPVVIRMRNVVWPPPSTNRPSLVLYVHRPESPDRAESYSWADPDARMVGINLRWVQASCTRTGDAS